jgi:hypothetical protein
VHAQVDGEPWPDVGRVRIVVTRGVINVVV